jgi:acyl-CoA synthetase (AMP-forming)/AMP-acid ligase II
MTITDRSPDQRDVLGIGQHGDAPAVVLDDRVLTHAELDGLVDQRCAQLGSTRRLVLVECRNALEPLVTYLAALRGRHPVLLVPPSDGSPTRNAWQRVISAYDPDVVLTLGGSGWQLDEVRVGTRHDLHPDLALLLGTSGSTGTPKLVRLSRENLRSNATAIASYLHLDRDSRAATTLPIHYCYGLSVVNSHLSAGGSLWLTDRSVVDDGFWRGFQDAGATSFAGVPYTFELLERSGADWHQQPGLRQVTQAGGRLAPERVRELALRGRRHGFDLYVMYGQTEATARMAYLPPDLAAERPSTVGIPIDGGELRIDDGELVYSGPNVMLGYAESAADLALGATLSELRTGDLAVQHDDGLYELVGRRTRIAKPFGVRLDLDLAERLLGERGVDARVTSEGDTLHVLVLDAAHRRPAVRALTEAHCLPAHAVHVRVVDEFPTTPSGKPDYAAMVPAGESVATDDAGQVRAAYEIVLGRPVDDDDTFVALGGDSLSYVEMVLRLERILGTPPVDWPRRTVGELAARTARPRRRLARVETPLLLRALAITLIVGSHVELWDVMGGAHALLALFGYNLARFALQMPDRRRRVAAVSRTLCAVAVPSVLWIGAVALVTGKYTWSTSLLLNGFLGADRWSDQWQFWFLETAVWSTVGLGALVLLPRLARWSPTSPLTLPLVVLAAALLLRSTSADDGRIVATYSVAATAWCVVLGWAAAAASTTRQRLLVSALVPLCTHGFFGDDLTRELVVVVGTWAIVWLPGVLVPRPVDRGIAWLGGASLFVYLTHWVVYPHLERDHQVLAFLASMALGLAVWRAYVGGQRLFASVRRTRGDAQCSRTGSASTP